MLLIVIISVATSGLNVCAAHLPSSNFRAAHSSTKFERGRCAAQKSLSCERSIFRTNVSANQRDPASPPLDLAACNPLLP